MRAVEIRLGPQPRRPDVVLVRLVGFGGRLAALELAVRTSTPRNAVGGLLDVRAGGGATVVTRAGLAGLAAKEACLQRAANAVALCEGV